MNIPILYEDNAFLVIDKPPGIVVNRAESVKAETVQDWVEDKLKIKTLNFKIDEKDFINRAGIVHRIDKETSGILLIAKTPEAFRELQRQFKEREVKKTYLALVHGKLAPEEGEIRAPVGRLPWNPERFGIVPGGKEAVTSYARISNVHPPAGGPMSNETLTVVALYPESGRTHQIRVHLKYINHPIVGDYLYAGRKVSRSDRAWAPRVMLHAWKISFTHPNVEQDPCLPCLPAGRRQGRLALEAPIPDDMKRLI